jgi:hypothetical protein
MANQNSNPPGTSAPGGQNGHKDSFGQGTPGQGTSREPYVRRDPFVQAAMPPSPQRSSYGQGVVSPPSSSASSSRPPGAASASSASEDASSASFSDLQARATEVAKSAYERTLAFCKANPKLATSIGLGVAGVLTRRLFRR